MLSKSLFRLALLISASPTDPISQNKVESSAYRNGLICRIVSKDRKEQVAKYWALRDWDVENFPDSFLLTPKNHIVISLKEGMRNTQEAMNMFQNLIYYEKLFWSPQFLIPVLSRMCVWRYSNEIITISYVVTNSEGIIHSAGDLIVARPLLIEKRYFVSSCTYCLLINSLHSPWKF